MQPEIKPMFNAPPVLCQVVLCKLVSLCHCLGVYLSLLQLSEMLQQSRVLRFEIVTCEVTFIPLVEEYAVNDFE